MLLQSGIVDLQGAIEGFWFEICVIACVAIMTMLAYNKYRQKNKNFAALLLFLVFLNWTIAVVFSWLAKVLTINLYPTGGDPDITDATTYFIRLVLDFRLLFIFVAIALYFSYMLRVKLFEKGYVRGERAVNVIFLVLIPVLCFSLNQRSNMIYTVIVFASVLAYMLIVYVPFMRHSLAAYKGADPKFKDAFLALSFMSLFFILTFVNFLLDQVLIAVNLSLGYSICYFLAWICAVIAIVLTYYGYIKPRGA